MLYKHVKENCNGTIVRIELYYPPEKLKVPFEEICSVIFNLCKTSAVYRNFKWLVVRIKKLSMLSGARYATSASVRTEDLEKKQAIVNINPLPIKNKSFWFFSRDWKSRLEESMVHESVHILHDFASSAIRSVAEKKLRASLAHMESQVDLKSGVNLRVYLSFFIKGVFFEGIADYGKFCFRDGQEVVHQRFEKKFNKYYKQAKRIVLKVVKLQHKLHDAIISKDKKRILKAELAFKEMVEANLYEVGIHIVSSLFMFDKGLTFKKLLNTGSFTAIKNYCDYMDTIGLQPVVSINDSKGIFDYDSALLEWRNLEKKI